MRLRKGFNKNVNRTFPEKKTSATSVNKITLSHKSKFLSLFKKSIKRLSKPNTPEKRRLLKDMSKWYDAGFQKSLVKVMHSFTKRKIDPII